jgi:hypothetical protein
VVNTREDREISLGERCKQPLIVSFAEKRLCTETMPLSGIRMIPHFVQRLVGLLVDIFAETTSLRVVAKSLSKLRVEIRDIYPADRLELMACRRRKISSYWG